MKIVIIGGVAGGATAAARARRLSESAEIVVFERGEYVSFANCGLPYHIGEEIKKRESLLVQTKEGLSKRFRLDIRTRTEVIKINRQEKTVSAKDLESGREYTESYDFLILSPGAMPLLPPVSGTELPGTFTLRNMRDMDAIKAAVDRGVKSAVIIGAGFIGLEMAENLVRRGLKVSVVEILNQVMPVLDSEITRGIQKELEKNGVSLFLGETAEKIARNESGVLTVSLKSGKTISADMVIFSAGVRPDSGLAEDAGLELTDRKAILVDQYLRTGDFSIYAVGDAVSVKDFVLGRQGNVPLAGPANRQARIAVDHIFGREVAYKGVLGTSVVKVFSAVAASTGASEKALKRAGTPYRKVHIFRSQHVGYYPGASVMLIKVLFTPDTGKILGAQVSGKEGVDKRIDVLATAIYGGMTVFDLQHLELAYAPQFGAAKDPVNIAGYVAVNYLSGEEDFIFPEDIQLEQGGELAILDVREPAEFKAGHIPGAMHIPLGELRQRVSEVPAEKPLIVYCGVGQRAWYATRILRQNGFHPRNLSGGISLWAIERPNDMAS